MNRTGSDPKLAAAIEARAGEYPEDCDSRARAEIRIGTLTIRCRACRPAVMAVAAKYRRGVWSLYTGALPVRPSMRRPKDSDAVLAQLAAECGDNQALPE